MAAMSNPVQDWMGAEGPQQLAIATDLAGSIDLGVDSLLNLLRDIGPYIGPEEDLTTVGRVFAILPVVFSKLQSEPSRHDVVTLSDYFCIRLRNEANIPSFRAGTHEIATCLNIMIKWNHFPPREAAPVASAVFSLADHRFKDLKPITRLTLYNVLDDLFRNKANALIKESGIKLNIDGLVAVAEFEKNPACLEVLFALYAHIGQEWDLEGEEFQKLWKSFDRYYPITVGGPASDSSQPTAEKLRDLLLECILSNDYYAKEAFPMLLEKLDTTQDLSATTKNEVLATLAACAESYSVQAVAPWVSKIWDSLKFEVWNGENDDFMKASLKVLLALSASLSRTAYDWTSVESPLAYYVLAASKECSERILDLKTQFLRPSGMILCSIASASPLAFDLVIKTVLPRLYVLWQDLKLGSEKNLVLGVLNNLLIARLSQPDIMRESATASMQDEDSQAQIILKMKQDFAKFSENLVDVYFGAVTKAGDEAKLAAGLDVDSRTPVSPPDPAYGVAAIKGLTLLSQIPEYLSDVEQGMIVQKLTDFATNPSQDEEIKFAVVDSLQHISAVEPRVFHDITLASFMDKLPKTVSTDSAKSAKEIETILELLENLVDICCTTVCKKEFSDGPPPGAAAGYWHRNFDSMITNILVKLRAVMQQEKQNGYAVALLAAILNALEKFDKTLDHARSHSAEPQAPVSASGPYKYIVMALFNAIVEQKFDPNGQIYLGLKPAVMGTEHEDIFVELVGKVAMLALRSKSTTALNNFVLTWNDKFPREPSVLWTLFTHTEDQILASSQKDLQNGPADKCLANALAMFLVAGTSPKSKNGLRIPVGDVAAAMIQNAVSLTNKSSRFSQISMMHFLQLLVNKFGACRENLTGDAKLLDIMQNLVADCPSLSGAEVARVYQVLAYFTAASLACFDSTMEALIKLMIDGVPHIVHGRKVAQSFRILLDKSPILTEENFCTIRKLRKPRLFTLAVEPLITLWKKAINKGLKDNYLIAIAGIIVYMEPEQLVEGDLAERLIPVILEGVTVKDDDWAKVAFLKTLVSITPLVPKLIQEHFDSVLNRVSDRLRNTYDSPSDGSVECRVLALEVLILLVKFIKPSLLLQRSVKFLAELDAAKDDVAWEVRKKAVHCRMEWWLLADKANAY